MRSVDSFLAGTFWLIFAYLLFKNWKGANSLLNTGITGGNNTIKNLQGR